VPIIDLKLWIYRDTTIPEKYTSLPWRERWHGIKPRFEI
jgi:hypothetical protein